MKSEKMWQNLLKSSFLRRDFKGASADDGHLHLLQSELSVFSSGEQGKTRKSGGVSDAEAIECARKQQLSVKSL